MATYSYHCVTLGVKLGHFRQSQLTEDGIMIDLAGHDVINDVLQL